MTVTCTDPHQCNENPPCCGDLSDWTRASTLTDPVDTVDLTIKFSVKTSAHLAPVKQDMEENCWISWDWKTQQEQWELSENAEKLSGVRKTKRTHWMTLITALSERKTWERLSSSLLTWAQLWTHHSSLNMLQTLLKAQSSNTFQESE